MFNAQDIILARQFKPDLSISKLDTESLILLKIMNNARGGGVVPVYDADITNGIASFSGVTKSKPLVSLKINIPVTQSGSGTPSPTNIRDFVDVSGVQLFRGGADLLENTSFENGTILTTDGGTEESSGYITYDFIDVSNMNTIAIRSAKEATAGRYFRVCGYDSTKTFTTRFISQIRRDGEFTDFFDVSDVDYIRICWANNTTLFEAYNGNTYPITFGQTVYSAILDVLTGKLSITHELKTIDENTNIAMSQSTVGIFNIPNFFEIANDTDSIMCNTYEKATNRSGGGGVINSNPDYSYCCQTTDTRIYIKDMRFENVTDYKTWLSTNPVKIAVKLAEPIEIQLTPTVINTLIGENVIFADVGDITECKYTRK